MKEQDRPAILMPGVYYRIIVFIGALDVIFELWAISHNGRLRIDRYNLPLLLSGPFLIGVGGYGLRRKVGFAKLPLEIRMITIVAIIGLVIFTILLINFLTHGY